MSSQPKKLRDLDPTVIPAHPGYRIASISTKDDVRPNADTRPEDLWIGYDPVIAWCIRPSLEEFTGYSVVNHAGVDAITVEGIIDGNNTYLVHPDGKWSSVGFEDFENEQEARRHWIRTNLNG